MKRKYTKRSKWWNKKQGKKVAAVFSVPEKFSRSNYILGTLPNYITIIKTIENDFEIYFKADTFDKAMAYLKKLSE